MSEWLRNLTGYFLFLSVAMVILPDKKYEPYVKLFTGFVLLLLLLQPILRIGSMDAYIEESVLEMVEEQEVLEKRLLQETEKFSGEMEEEEYKEAVTEVEEIEVEVRVSE